MAWYEDPAIITIIAAVVVIIAVSACVMVLYAMKHREKKTPQEKPKQPGVNLELTNLPFKISKSVQTTMASSAKDELRILDLEREILSDAIRRLYEAHAEGKISEQEREKLAGTYKARMTIIKDSISKDENIVALHELEGMQEDLMKLFSERFGELTSKVEELRTKIDVKPIKEIPIRMPTQAPTQIEDEQDEEEEEEAGEDKPKKKRKPPVERPDQKTEAEKRIESIRSEVEKVLDKLGQMEIES